MNHLRIAARVAFSRTGSDDPVQAFVKEHHGCYFWVEKGGLSLKEVPLSVLAEDGAAWSSDNEVLKGGKALYALKPDGMDVNKADDAMVQGLVEALDKAGLKPKAKLGFGGKKTEQTWEGLVSKARDPEDAMMTLVGKADGLSKDKMASLGLSVVPSEPGVSDMYRFKEEAKLDLPG